MAEENIEFQKEENKKLKKTFAGDNPFYLGVRDDLNKIGPGGSKEIYRHAKAAATASEGVLGEASEKVLAKGGAK